MRPTSKAYPLSWVSEEVLLESGFLSFLKSHHIDTRDLEVSDPPRRYFRCAQGTSTSNILSKLFEEIKAQLISSSDTLDDIIKASWLPGFYSLPEYISIAKLGVYRQGGIYGMDIASGYTVALLDIIPGDHVLDLCCAPGAKLSMIADTLGGEGSVTGVDYSVNRLAACKQMLYKYQGSAHDKDSASSTWRCRLFHADGRTFAVGPKTECDQVGNVELIFDVKTLKENASTRKRMNKSARARQARREDVWTFDPTLYDKVLVDAECTHDGSIRHLQKLRTLEAWTKYTKTHLNDTQLERIRNLQHHLIRNGFRLLKVGGIMIYSTCSLSIRQNEDIVHEFLSETPNAKLFEIHPHDSVPCDPGSLKGTLRFSPRRNTSGLFIARIQKIEDNGCLLGVLRLIPSAHSRMRSRPVSSSSRQLLVIPRTDAGITQIDSTMPAEPAQVTYEDNAPRPPFLTNLKAPETSLQIKHLKKSQSVPALSKTNTGLRPTTNTTEFRDTFNTHRTRIHYGSRVALELTNGHLLTVQSPNGHVCISDPAMNEREEACDLTMSPPKKLITAFTFVHLTDPQTTAELHFGDPVWLKISSGKGEDNWEHGGVLGVNIRQMPKLKLAACTRRISNALVVGTPVPITAYVPKHRDSIESDIEIAQCQKRNTLPALLGKWIIRSAGRDSCKTDMHQEFVCNLDEIFLDQDWFHLAASIRTEDAILRPTAEQDNTLFEKIKASSDISQVWRIRLFDQQDGHETRSTLKQQQRDRLLLRAKRQLMLSMEERSRHGRTRAESELIGKPKLHLAELPLSTYCNSLAQTVTLSLDSVPQKTRLQALVRCGDVLDPICTLDGDTANSDSHLESDIWPNRSFCAETRICGLCRSSTMGYGLCCQAQDTCLDASSASDSIITLLMQHEDKKLAGIIRSKMERSLTLGAKQNLTFQPD